ncbi:hypothetical protein [Pontibacter korlensis]|uniref:hypothetical protein n=1 Tax=Pontibacter korlensis TaxID=400092 RepID=UPI000AFA79EE|nr:hypothetical protein [Pontibacter korlensis]
MNVTPLQSQLLGKRVLNQLLLLILALLLLGAGSAHAQNAYTDAGIPLPTDTSDKDD